MNWGAIREEDCNLCGRRRRFSAAEVGVTSGVQGVAQNAKAGDHEEGLSLTFVPAGSRNEARRQFTVRMRSTPSDIVFGLLVDSEGPLTAELPGQREQNAHERRLHLVTRDGWQLTGFPEEHIHLMVR